MSSREMAAIQEHGEFDIITVSCILKLVALHKLEDDGLDLFRRVVGRWDDVEVEVHGLLVGGGDNFSSFDADGEVEEDSRFGGLGSVPGKLAKGQRF